MQTGQIDSPSRRITHPEELKPLLLIQDVKQHPKDTRDDRTQHNADHQKPCVLTAVVAFRRREKKL
jgi:hypothetical protein